MALQQFKQPWLSEEDYLAGEQISEIKHEYIDGQAYAMSGTSANHGRIVSALTRLIGNPLIVCPATFSPPT